MEVIDTVLADSLEPGDLISYAGDEVEILESLESSEGDTRVAFRVYNLSSGMVEALSLPYDIRVNILGV